MNKKSLKKYNQLKQIKELIPRLDFLEIAGVLFADKPAMAQTNIGDYNEEFKGRLDQLYKILENVGLELAVSDFKIVVNSAEGIFKSVPLDDSRAGSVVVGISKDLDKALEAVACVKWKIRDDRFSRKFGELMGYPQCCLEFGDSLSDDAADQSSFGWENPALETLKNSDNFKWQLNVFTIEAIAPHIPCKLDCQKSVNYVNRILEVLKKYDPDLAKHRKRLLKDPISLFWHSADKVLLYGDYKRTGEDFLSAEACYREAEIRIDGHNYYYEGNEERANKLKEIANSIKKGNRLKVSKDKLEVFKGEDKIFEMDKENQYLPVLIAPDCRVKE